MLSLNLHIYSVYSQDFAHFPFHMAWHGPSVCCTAKVSSASTLDTPGLLDETSSQVNSLWAFTWSLHLATFSSPTDHQCGTSIFNSNLFNGALPSPARWCKLSLQSRLNLAFETPESGHADIAWATSNQRHHAMNCTQMHNMDSEHSQQEETRMIPRWNLFGVLEHLRTLCRPNDLERALRVDARQVKPCQVMPLGAPHHGSQGQTPLRLIRQTLHIWAGHV